MTVTIGAICGANPTLQTGSIVLCADTLISWTAGGVPVTSNPAGSKLFDLPLGFYGALADDISRTLQVRSYLYQLMGSISPSDPRRIDLIETAIQETAEYVRSWMRQEVLGRHNVTLDEFLHDTQLASRAEIEEEINSEVIPTQLIIAGFSLTGGPLLLFTDCKHTQRQTRPGFFCGGAGGAAALDWLNMREQNSLMSIQRTVYHVHEAKRFAERSPVVGLRHHAVLLQHNRPMVAVGGNRPLLSEWLSRYQPQSTDVLDSPEAYADFAKTYDISDSTNSSGDHT